MVTMEFIQEMFNLPQETHPERLWVLNQKASPSGGKVAYDLGCGLNKTVEEAIGVDINPVTNLTASLDDLRSVETSSVDVIFSRHSLEHMLDLMKTLKEWRRILKKDGKMVIVLPEHGELDTMSPIISGGKHLHAFNKESFRSFIGSSYLGLKIEKIETIVPNWSFGVVIGIDKDVLYWDEEILSTTRYDTLKNQITGMMSDEELTWLYDHARKMTSVLEIGSWMGRSAHALLSGCPGSVHCVDHFLGSADPIETGNRDVFQYFMQNVGHFSNLIPHKMSSLEAVKLFEDKSLDFVFVDGGHQYLEALYDIKAWLPKAKKMIAVHDYHAEPVKRAVDELLPGGQVVGTIYYKNIE